MKRMWTWAVILILGYTLTNPAIASRYPRDFSGDAMQRHDSQLPSSPMSRFPGVLGLTYWPFIAYPPAPTMQMFNFVIETPGETAPVVQNKPPASSKFWIGRCGTFVEIDVAKANLIEEESKACPP